MLFERIQGQCSRSCSEAIGLCISSSPFARKASERDCELGWQEREMKRETPPLETVGGRFPKCTLVLISADKKSQSEKLFATSL